MSGKICSADYVLSTATPSDGGYETVAHADFDTNTVTLFAPYTNSGLNAQAQTLMHEAMHLTFNFSDQHLGTAATGKQFDSKSGAKASAAFQQKLLQHCK